MQPKSTPDRVTRYAITHVNKDGLRTLTFANQGRNHYDTREAAEKSLALFVKDGSLREKVLRDMADTLAVRPFECYHHGDAVGIYYHGPVERKVDELGGFVINNPTGHEAHFDERPTADAFVRWMDETKRFCSQTFHRRPNHVVAYNPKLDHDHE